MQERKTEFGMTSTIKYEKIKTYFLVILGQCKALIFMLFCYALQNFLCMLWILRLIPYCSLLKKKRKDFLLKSSLIRVPSIIYTLKTYYWSLILEAVIKSHCPFLSLHHTLNVKICRSWTLFWAGKGNFAPSQFFAPFYAARVFSPIFPTLSLIFWQIFPENLELIGQPNF